MEEQQTTACVWMSNIWEEQWLTTCGKTLPWDDNEYGPHGWNWCPWCKRNIRFMPDEEAAPKKPPWTASGVII